MKYRVWFLLAILLSPMALADILWMDNGDRLTGTIEEITDEQVRIALPYSSPVTVKREAVKRWRIEKQDKPKPTVKTGITLRALTTQDDKRAWLWTGSSDLNVRLRHNEKQTNNVNLKAETEVANLDWRYSLNGEYIYETANNVTNKHEYQLKPMLDFFFDQHWFVRSSIDYDYQMLDANYLNLSYASGPGYRFWNDKKRRLELITQVGLERTYLRPAAYDESIIADIFDDRIINYPLLNLGWDYRQPVILWSESIEIFSKGGYKRYLAQPSPYVTREQSIQGSLGLRYYFNDHLRLSWSSELDWEDARLDDQDIHQQLAGKEWRHLISLGASF
ncbi:MULTISPECIES: DUF481 domain-containing protein [Aeromonas]|jgi:hypothetical protein|uniref:DUF481 domain-containing protein n=1 Tax=Aeromonas popoffii TaxID=70856 RepID=A0ABS5GXA4_9GAMM|nr:MULTISPECIES: DUF481 domain-containing protein [Aeromonas]MBR7631452.1 DUF481 domain-containing protein [Aeromonas popoffii]MDF2415068.1 DUF481 domain-containing protein [Aeromonas sp. 1HA1]